MKIVQLITIVIIFYFNSWQESKRVKMCQNAIKYVETLIEEVGFPYYLIDVISRAGVI